MAAYGLYSHIKSNRRRSIALLIGLFFLVYLLVFAGARVAEGLTSNAPLDYLVQAAIYDFTKAAPFATVGTIVWVAIAYKFHQSMIDAVTGAREVSRAEEPRLYNLLENLCISRGMMSALNDREMEAVLGHELTHIRNGDVRMLVIAVVIAGVISFFGEMIFRLMFQGAR